MPYTINGFGTSVCTARGHIKWGDGDPDCDAAECVVILFMPVLPYKCIHAYDWSAMGNQYKSIPIRWSLGLIARAYARRWLVIPIVGGIIFAVCGLVILATALTDPKAPGAKSDITGGLSVAGAGLAAAALGYAGWKVLERTDQRTRDIRLILGHHQFGSSDPATWKREMLASVKSAQELHGTSTHADGVYAMMGKGRSTAAMWAARLTTALEDRARGESLTSEVLESPAVADLLQRLRKNPKARTEPATAGQSEEQSR